MPWVFAAIQSRQRSHDPAENLMLTPTLCYTRESIESSPNHHFEPCQLICEPEPPVVKIALLA